MAALSWRRRAGGFVLALGGLPGLTAWLLAADGSLTDDILLFLAAVVAVALAGGLWPALVAAVGGFLLLNWYFTPPLHTLAVATAANLIALGVFVVVAVAVSSVVDLAARRTRQAGDAAAEARTLAAVAGGVLGGTNPLDALLRQLRDTLGFESAALLERLPTGWQVAATTSPPGRTTPPPITPPTASTTPPLITQPAASTTPPLITQPADSGAPAPIASPADNGAPAPIASPADSGAPAPTASPADWDAAVPADETLTLVLRGRALTPGDRRIVRAFAAQAAVALRQQRLTAVEEADRMRTALLAAVSHDLRTPLASAKAAVAGLRSPDVAFDERDRAELLATADESLDRLAGLVANLLDMSRLQAGALGMTPADIGLEDVVPRALDELGPAGRHITVDLPDDLPAVRADPGLLDRVLVNVVGNALRFSPPGRPPALTGRVAGDLIELHVVDRGKGIPESDWNRVFQPFQRLGDRDNHTGVGLGLALSRGLTEAMGGTLRPEPTPGGGLTMVIALPKSPAPATPAPTPAAAMSPALTPPTPPSPASTPFVSRSATSGSGPAGPNRPGSDRAEPHRAGSGLTGSGDGQSPGRVRPGPGVFNAATADPEGEDT